MKTLARIRKTALRVAVTTPMLAVAFVYLTPTSATSAQLSDETILALSTYLGTTHKDTSPPVPCYDCHPPTPNPWDYQTWYKYAIPVSCLECHQ